jgi:hypothetical protein
MRDDGVEIVHKRLAILQGERFELVVLGVCGDGGQRVSAVLREVCGQRLIEVTTQGPYGCMLEVLEADAEGLSAVIHRDRGARSESTVHELVVGSREVSSIDVGPREVLLLAHKDVVIFGRTRGW